MILKLSLFLALMMLSSCVIENNIDYCKSYETMSVFYALSIESVLTSNNIDYTKIYKDRKYKIFLHECDFDMNLDSEILNAMNSQANIKIGIGESKKVFDFFHENNIEYLVSLKNISDNNSCAFRASDDSRSFAIEYALKSNSIKYSKASEKDATTYKLILCMDVDYLDDEIERIHRNLESIKVQNELSIEIIKQLELNNIAYTSINVEEESKVKLIWYSEDSLTLGEIMSLEKLN